MSEKNNYKRKRDVQTIENENRVSELVEINVKESIRRLSAQSRTLIKHVAYKNISALFRCK